MTMTDDRRIYDASGKLVYAPRSNVGLSADELFPGPGAGVPRRMGMTAITLAQSGEIMGPETEDLLQGD